MLRLRRGMMMMMMMMMMMGMVMRAMMMVMIMMMVMVIMMLILGYSNWRLCPLCIKRENKQSGRSAGCDNDDDDIRVL